MQGLMMDVPLLISNLIRHAARYHGDTEIVTRTVEGPIHRYTWGDAYRRVQKLANALKGLGVQPGDRLATLAWNTHRHLELYYGISGMGAVLHTINPRLFPEQIRYIVNHADDQWIFVDLTFVPMLEKLAAEFPRVKGYVILTDDAHLPQTTLPNVRSYESLIADQPAEFDWPQFDEKTASSLCYTSGTTGNPKGVLYTHRSTVLHCYCVCSPDALGICSRDSLLPVVPMFHVNAWGCAYSTAMAGAKLVLPGAKLDGASLYELFESEGVTITLGVPTVWLGLLAHMAESGHKFSTLQRLVVGGSAAPLSMIVALEEDYGVDVIHAWGMTEMSPIGTTGVLKGKMLALPKEDRYKLKMKQGRVVYGVELKIVDDTGNRLPHDGTAQGELLVRGPWITSGYFEDEAASKAAFDSEGWFRTGDICTIDADGFVQITDRAKDIIKSGGEWISSIDLENAAVGHPGVAEAAVIGVHHPKWQERPLLIVKPRKAGAVGKDEMLKFLEQRVAKWWLPDDVIFVEELPHTATGKLLKSRLREEFGRHRLPGA
ncbi:3-(methylthio)propionyl-CoA ligase [Stella sp.]|uniref:3-(methylthio)propionyl-CoA ligase n=1 Tax=Stella sp. TaxID=2912054 RepID=UPI0035AFDC9D